MSKQQERKFAECSSVYVESLQQKQYAKKTHNAIASAEKTLSAFLKLKGLSDIPKEAPVLNDILSALWPSLRTLSGDEYHASSLQAIRSCMRIVRRSGSVKTQVCRLTGIIQTSQTKPKSGHGPLNVASNWIIQDPERGSV